MTRRIIGVMGSGQVAPEWAGELGAGIARRGWHLLTGGGAGVMAAVSRGYVESEVPGRGLCLGIMPDGRQPNPWVEVPIRTPLGIFNAEHPDEITRNSINILTADFVVVLPGNHGTRNEVDLSLKYGKPLVLVGQAADFEGYPSGLNRVETVEQALEAASAHLR